MLIRLYSMNTGIKEFWEKYEFRVVLAVGFVLIAAVSFEFGYMQGKSIKATPLVIEKSPESPKNDVGCSVSAPLGSNGASDQKVPIQAKAPIATNLSMTQANCVFVGSKNSNKFYPPTCSYAKRIKPENVVCFATAQEALAQGRTASTGCK